MAIPALCSAGEELRRLNRGHLLMDVHPLSLFVFAGANAAILPFRPGLSGRAFTLVNHSLHLSSHFPFDPFAPATAAHRGGRC